MSEFIDALKKTEPKMFEEPKEDKMVNVDEQPQPTGVTLQDMKDYFDALKQSLTADMKKEILDTLKAQNDSNTDNGDTNTNNNKEE